MVLFYTPHNHQVLLALGKARDKQEIVIDALLIYCTIIFFLYLAPLKTALTSCSVSPSDLQSILELMDYYRSDLAQALIRHERSLQVALHQVKLIGKDKCASENLQVLHCSSIQTLYIDYCICCM